MKYGRDRLSLARASRLQATIERRPGYCVLNVSRSVLVRRNDRRVRTETSWKFLKTHFSPFRRRLRSTRFSAYTSTVAVRLLFLNRNTVAPFEAARLRCWS